MPRDPVDRYSCLGGPAKKIYKTEIQVVRSSTDIGQVLQQVRHRRGCNNGGSDHGTSMLACAVAVALDTADLPTERMLEYNALMVL